MHPQLHWEAAQREAVMLTNTQTLTHTLYFSLSLTHTLALSLSHTLSVFLSLTYTHFLSHTHTPGPREHAAIEGDVEAFAQRAQRPLRPAEREREREWVSV